MDTTVLWKIPLQTLAIYLVVLLGLRLSGKRQLGQMNAIDLVLLLLIANAVQNAMTGGDNSLLGGILAAVTLFVANLVLSYARGKVPALRAVVEGKATDLIRDGQVLTANLEHEEITKEELLAALREHGIEDAGSVKHAALEVDGSISVVPVESSHLRGRRRAVRFIKSQH
jgi:uncharacterized membrane protein YcaP (DUF421 family)